MKKNLKKLVVGMLSVAVFGSVLTGCGATNSAITVVSREDGSGTRSAFTEIIGVAVDDEDHTVATAEVTNSTSVMMTTIEGNENAIGYISMGSLNDSVKAVQVDGVEATPENVKSGDYKVSRPFEICISKDGTTEVAKDFINYILSDDGQAVITEEGYISVTSGHTYEAAGMEGKITIAGSTSVAPVMEILAEEYKELNPNVVIEIQQTGSSAGIESATQGACDIGMSSRSLKEEELANLEAIRIAMDGICVIVNVNATVSDLTAQQIKDIYVGTITDWSQVE
ncbi:MAG: substrate-binding domain-containing protein [Lachnospiraceae bacterium]|nr:substrate-binding domain-containing protein [Lachnospiraceae bacterium]